MIYEGKEKISNHEETEKSLIDVCHDNKLETI